MHDPREKPTLVWDERLVADGGQPFPASPRIIPIQNFCPDDAPVLVMVSATELVTGHQLLQQINPAAKARSLITAVLRTEETPPTVTPPHTTFLPNSEAEILLDWLRLLLGEAAQVHVAWFTSMHQSHANRADLQRLQLAFSRLLIDDVFSSNREALAGDLGWSVAKLDGRCRQLYSASAAELLRVRRLFALSACCMQEELCRPPGRVRRHSPLMHMPGDFRRSLQKLLGISYRQFWLAAKREHWAAVWMRAWWERCIMKFK